MMAKTLFFAKMEGYAVKKEEEEFWTRWEGMPIYLKENAFKIRWSAFLGGRAGEGGEKSDCVLKKWWISFVWKCGRGSAADSFQTSGIFQADLNSYCGRRKMEQIHLLLVNWKEGGSGGVPASRGAARRHFTHTSGEDRRGREVERGVAYDLSGSIFRHRLEAARRRERHAWREKTSCRLEEGGLDACTFYRAPHSYAHISGDRRGAWAYMNAMPGRRKDPDGKRAWNEKRRFAPRRGDLEEGAGRGAHQEMQSGTSWRASPASVELCAAWKRAAQRKRQNLSDQYLWHNNSEPRRTTWWPSWAGCHFMPEGRRVRNAWLLH